MRSWYRNFPIGLIVVIGIAIYGYVQVSDSKKDSTTRSEDGKVIEAGKVGFEVLKIGDCALHPNGYKQDENDEIENVHSYSVVPCTDLHDVEMYSSRMLGFSPYPGVAALSGELSDFCVYDLATYTGLESDSLGRYEIALKVPMEQAWSNGDRTILCFAFLNSGEKLSLSIRK